MSFRHYILKLFGGAICENAFQCNTESLDEPIFKRFAEVCPLLIIPLRPIVLLLLNSENYKKSK